MPSSKKLRAKQRKEATRVASNNAIQTAADKLMDGIRQGSSSITQSAAWKVSRKKNPAMLHRLIDDGLLDVLLGFFAQCEQVKIGDVQIDGRKIEALVANPLDAISCPLVWFSLIISSVTEGSLPTTERTALCRLKVSKFIGPVVRCMCGNEELFESKEHWYASIRSFVSLVATIVRRKESIAILLEYGGLIAFIVQSMFFDVYRPDVLFNAKIEHFRRDILILGEQIVRSVVLFYIQEEKVCRIRTIAATRIEGSCISSFVAGLFSILEPTIYPLVNLFIITGNVDKDVITSVINLGKNSPDYEGAIFFANCIFDVLAPVKEDWKRNMLNMPNANFFAFAIDQGLVSVCLKLLVQHEQEDQYTGYKLLTQLGLILTVTCGVSLSSKSFKALLRQRDHIMKVIQCADTSNQRSQGILRTIKKAVLLRSGIEKFITTTEKCDYCSRSLSNAEVKLCGSCLKVTYCSRKCQEKHWLIHQHHCNQVASNGINTPDSKAKKREKAQARNMHAVADKFIADNLVNILAQASLHGYDIVNCAVVIDLVLCPSVEVKLIADLTEDERSSLEDLDLSEGRLASVCYSLPHNACGPALMYSRVHNGSWQDAQIRYKNGDFTEEYHNDENARVMRELFFVDLAPVKPH